MSFSYGEWTPVPALAGLVEAIWSLSGDQLFPSPIGAVADRVVRSWGGAPMDDLARDVGLSHRQLGRRFQLEVGLRPKLRARICRFQRVFHALEASPAHWAQVASDCGYYDSSHLIRDFRELAGETPSRLIEESDRLTGLFTRAQRTRR